MRKFDEAKTLFYTAPAADWNAALPLGNGKIGAMVHGGVEEELLALNYDELWTGYPNHPVGKNVRDVFEEARKAFLAGDKIRGNQLIQDNFSRDDAEAYMPFGNLRIRFAEKKVSGYVRRLSLDDAVHTVEYDTEGGHVRRETFVSYPDNALIMQLTADGDTLDFSVSMDSEMKYAAYTLEGGILALDGECIANSEFNRRTPEKSFYYSEDPAKRGICYRGVVKVKTDGKFSMDVKALRVEGAHIATLFFTVESSFNGYDKHPFLEGKEYQQKALEKLAAVSEKSYESLLEAHKADYMPLFARVEFDLGFGLTDVPTDERLLRHGQDPEKCADKGLVGLLFHFGRYLTLASSRPGTEVTNLQGIWNNSINPPWHCDCTTNINTEMNYYPTLMCNMAECYEPLLHLVRDLAVTGKKTAMGMYSARGFTCHHNTDIWRKTTPTTGLTRWMFWPLSSGWFANHVYEYYMYTQDKDYLAKEGLPLMKEAARFYLDLLSEDQDGYLVFAPSTSPENEYVFEGQTLGTALTSTMTMSIITQLFGNILSAAEILGETDDVTEEIRKAYGRLLPFRVGKDGRLLEWYEEEEEAEVTHRHVSHLYALHPGHLISPKKTPELAEACRKTLEKRGDEGTGWSLGWKINFWARLGDGNRAAKLLAMQLRPANGGGVTYYPVVSHYLGGTYPNLFDSHPPFQIDGNFGATSGVAEMLMQSDGENIYILPALPDAWQEGHISGLVAMGNIKVDIAWKNGILTECHTEGKTQGISVFYKGMKIN